MTTAHPVGAIVLTHTPGIAGLVTSIMLWANGDYSEYNHTGIVDGDGTTFIEARPGGARRSPLSELGNYVVYVPNTEFIGSELGARIAQVADSLIGTPYSFLDYGSIFLLRIHIRPQFIVNFVANRHHMICSQLDDYCYDKGGHALFDDGRYPGDVTPGDLYQLILEEKWIKA